MTQSSKNAEPRDAIAKPMRIIMWLLASCGLLFCLLLFAKSIGLANTLPGCNGETINCDALLIGRWAKVFGIPVTVPALLIYIGIIAGLWLTSARRVLQQRNLGWRLLLLTTMIAGGAAIYFVILQLVAEQTICPYCMIVHACSLLLLILAVIHAPIVASTANDFDEPVKDTVAVGGDMFGILIFAALIGLTGLIGAQLLVEPSMSPNQVGSLPNDNTTANTTSDDAVSPRAKPPRSPAIDDQGRRLFLQGRVAIDPNDMPIYGSPDAPHIVLAIYDYNCPMCRQSHKKYERAMAHFDGKLAVLAAPLPMNHQCNAYHRVTPPGYETSCVLAKLALAVWRVDAAKFAAFDRYLFQGDTPPTPGEATDKAADLVGRVALDAALQDPWIQQQIGRTLDWWTLIPDGPTRVIPMLFTPNVYLAGRVETQNLLHKFLQESMQITLPATDGDVE